MSRPFRQAVERPPASLPKRTDQPKGHAMNDAGHLHFLRDLSWSQIVLVIVVVVGSQVLLQVVRWTVRRVAESAPSHRRLLILRASPIARLLIGLAAIAVV